MTAAALPPAPLPATGPLVLVAAADDRYAYPLAVTLFSALEALSPRTRAEVHVLDGGISPGHRLRIERVLANVRPDVSLVWHDVGNTSLPDAPEGHYTTATYLRLLVPALIPVPRVLYLDSDLLVQDDLTEVWATPLGGHAVGAARDVGYPTLGSMDSRGGQEADLSQPYFNAGVLLMDLDWWRENDLAARVLENLSAHGDDYRLGEQDALNMLLEGDWAEFAPRWNMAINAPRDELPPPPDVGIIHYTGGYKPWAWQYWRARDAAYFRVYAACVRRSGWFTPAGYARWRARVAASTAMTLARRAVTRGTVPETPLENRPVSIADGGVTVCVCTRHRPDALRRCLASLKQSTVPVGQVVVSDDSEVTDRRTEALVAREFPDARYTVGPRKGLGANRNRALSEADRDYVLFLDDDAELAPTFLAEIAAFADAHELGSLDIVSGDERKAGDRVTPHEQSFLGYQRQPYVDGESVKTVVVNATLFPRRLFERVRFDEQLVYGCDEVDLTTRACQAGYRVWLCPEAVNPHHHVETGRDYYRPYAEASRLYVTLKRYAQTERAWGKATAFAVVAPLHLLAHSVKREGLRGVLGWGRSVRTATGYAVRHVLSRP